MPSIAIVAVMLILAPVLASSQLALKCFLRQFADLNYSFFGKLLPSLKLPCFWLTAIGVLVGVAIWIWLLPKVKLSFVYPMVSLSYVAMLFLSHFVEGEPIRSLQILGVALIVGGVTLLAIGN